MTNQQVRRNRERWATALESGRFKQFRGGGLHDCDSNSYCCLGVARVTLNPWSGCGGGYLNGSELAALGLSVVDMDRFAWLNDATRCTFAEIAGVVRHLPIHGGES